MPDANLSQQIERYGQQHVFQFWDEVCADEKNKLVEQLGHVDWNLIGRCISELGSSEDKGHHETGMVNPPSLVVRHPKTEDEIRGWEDAKRVGENAIQSGKVAAVLLAGGQGTRLGFPHPKGLFPIGPVSGKSLFEIFAHQLLALSDRFGQSIPYLIMTSDGTHEETIAFFEQHSFFGLKPDSVSFFQQGYSPCIDAKTGALLLADKGSMRMNPDGHGGLLAALLKAGLFDRLSRLGVEYLFTHQVDNPLVRICDPSFVGLHICHHSEVSTKVVAKIGPDEKVGLAVDVDGRTSIIEYSDLPKELAHERDENGELKYWAGNTAVHIFNRSFLERVATSEENLPWHQANKKIPYLDRHGQIVDPETENGIKFERFLFDTLPLAKTALIVESLREEEFAPLKNKEGDFSADYVRDQMVQVAKRWLKSAGVKVPEEAIVEISPRFAMSAADLALRSHEIAGFSFERPIYLVPSIFLQQDSCSLNRMTIHSDTVFEDPLVFDSFYRPQIWGGRGLKAHLNRELPGEGPYGEAWDVSQQALHVSRVIEGPFAGRDLNDLWTNCCRGLTGHENSGSFPLLVKWLECREYLSLQVHPDDQMAQRVLNQPFGKSEAWVVIFAEPTAKVFAGFKPGVTRSNVEFHLKNETLEECLHSFVPIAGDCISLPAGTVHAAGGGLVVAEVQQSSDATFRLYDWNRLGLDGKPRPLQIEHALEAINWEQGPISPIKSLENEKSSDGVQLERLVSSQAFCLERYIAWQSLENPHPGELTIWLILDGKAELRNPTTGYRKKFGKGSTTVIPSTTGKVIWEPIDGDGSLSLLCVRLSDSVDEGASRIIGASHEPKTTTSDP